MIAGITLLGVVAIAVFFAVVGGAGAAPALAAGLLAVVLPQVALLVLAGRGVPSRAFSWAASKFAVTVLLLAAAARGLHESGLLAAEYFIGGVVLAVMFNAMLSLRLGRAR